MSDSPPSELPRGRAGRLKALQEKMKAQQKAQQLKEEQNKLEITTATLISDPATQLASKFSTSLAVSKDSRSREEEGKPRPRHDPPLHNPLETSEQQERPPPVISRGTEGRAINISANYLKLNVDEGKGVFEYKVMFDPQIDNVSERYNLLAQYKDVLGNTKIFDGVKLFLPTKLPERVTSFACSTRQGETVTMNLVFKVVQHFGSKDSLYIFNILFRKIMNVLKLVQMNGNFYDPKLAISIPKHKLEIWPGYVIAVDDYKGGLHLQCDVSHRVLRSETVLDVLNTLTRDAKQRGTQAEIYSEVEKALLGCCVITRYNNKVYRIDDFDFDKIPTSTFENSRGETMTFMDYYERQYGIKIRFKNQPMVVNRPKIRSQSEQEVTRLIYLVPELCNLTGLTQQMRNDFRVMKDVEDHTKVTPAERKLAFKKYVDQINMNSEAKNILDNWGLSLGKETVKMTGRVLPATEIRFGGSYAETVGRNSDWTRTAISKQALTDINVDKWVIIFPEKAKDAAMRFYKMYSEVVQRMGFTVYKPKICCMPNDRNETYLKTIRDSIIPETQVVVTIVPSQRSDRYAAIKKLCYIDMPVANQIIVQKTIDNERKLQSVSQKIAIQINCKLGGEPWTCRIPSKKPLMLVGIDVFHDPVKKTASVAGFVSSLNSKYTRWHSTTCHQTPHQELVNALRLALVTALTKFYHVNHTYPSNIIIFRDGVGDSQLDIVQKHEVAQLKSAFESVQDNGQPYNPRFLFIVIQKRINTRIYEMSTINKLDNPPPGTIVDSNITRRNWYDFYLVSQKVTQGTVSPTHCIVIHDEADFPPDFIQNVTYTMTHMYYNWPGTVRVPAPCQYAHKLATIVGEHLRKPASEKLSEKLFYL